MKSYRWTKRIAIVGAGALAVIGISAIAVRSINVPIAGVQPEAYALTAVMTAPFTIGAVLLTVGIVALVETYHRKK